MICLHELSSFKIYASNIMLLIPALSHHPAQNSSPSRTWGPRGQESEAIIWVSELSPFISMHQTYRYWCWLHVIVQHQQQPQQDLRAERSGERSNDLHAWIITLQFMYQTYCYWYWHLARSESCKRGAKQWSACMNYHPSNLRIKHKVTDAGIMSLTLSSTNNSPAGSEGRKVRGMKQWFDCVNCHPSNLHIKHTAELPTLH